MAGALNPARNALAGLRAPQGPTAPAHAAAAAEDGAPPAFLGLQAEVAAGPEQESLRRIFARLGVEAAGLTEAEQRALVRALVAEEAAALPRAAAEAMEREILQSLGGRLGVLQPLLDDPTVTEVLVNGPGQVYVERAGRLERTDVRFRDERSLQALVERIVAPLGRSFTVAHPTVDARLPDGSRVHAVRPPVALLGTALSIRRFPRALCMRDLVEGGAFGAGLAWSDPDAVEDWSAALPPWRALAWCVRHGINTIVSGGTGTGKTTLLNALTEFVPDGERLVVIEDAAELQPRLPHVVRLEARPPNAEGSGAVTIQHLVVNALRMRPDRIVVGEVRDVEALDMLLAMNTGHDGSLTTVHANSPHEVFHRLIQATTLRGGGVQGMAASTLVDIAAAAVKLIVHVRRSAGLRRVDAIVAVDGRDESGAPRLVPLYRWAQGRLSPTGAVPPWGSDRGAVA